MADELVFYTNPMSRGRIARWMLEEVGEPYRTEIVQYVGMKSPEYRSINPMGKVPTISHRGTVVTECAAICAYLADAFPQANLAPPVTDPRRGTYYRWLFFAAGPVEAAVTNKAFGFQVPTEREATAGYGNFDATMDALEYAVTQGEYICGSQFTAADVYVGSHVGWGLMFGSIDKRPAFIEYAQRLQGRPAAQRAREIDDALLPKKENTSAT
jgi:glutathione S-transferase